MKAFKKIDVPLLVAAAFSSAYAQSQITLTITNNCSDSIWPALNTQNGTRTSTNGFELTSKASRNLTVATNWNGRIWGRTNCTFDSKGSGSCATGDCGGLLNCSGTGAASTLAEFNLPGYQDQSFYDISLVDGYNLPLAIIANPVNRSAFLPNQTNPSCVGSVHDVQGESFNPYKSGQQTFLGTSQDHPLPFENTLSSKDIATWCPYDLQQNPLDTSQADRPCPCFAGSDVAHPPFNPCLSACSKYGKSKFCCTGKHDKADTCGPNYYSSRAKLVCPDAYSYAYDDDKSTFAIQTGSSFEVVFCPGGRSTTILQTLREAATGQTSLAAIGVPNVGGLMSALFAVAVFMMFFG